jgi:hypothetical protein
MAQSEGKTAAVVAAKTKLPNATRIAFGNTKRHLALHTEKLAPAVETRSNRQTVRLLRLLL